MSLIVNGTIIPTNVANALKVNGVSVTSVICNGINAWLQSLIVPILTGGWSGNSLGWTGYGNMGLEMSGFSTRLWWNNFGSVSGWMVANLDGTWTTSLNSGGETLNVSGNNWMITGNFVYENTWATYNKNKTWTGGTAFGSNPYYGYESSNGGLNTSGGLIRYTETYFGVFGAWISLT